MIKEWKRTKHLSHLVKFENLKTSRKVYHSILTLKELPLQIQKTATEAAFNNVKLSMFQLDLTNKIMTNHCPDKFEDGKIQVSPGDGGILASPMVKHIVRLLGVKKRLFMKNCENNSCASIETIFDAFGNNSLKCIFLHQFLICIHLLRLTDKIPLRTCILH